MSVLLLILIAVVVPGLVRVSVVISPREAVSTISPVVRHVRALFVIPAQA